KKEGMFLLDEMLFRLWRTGVVEKEEVMSKSQKPAELANRIMLAERGELDEEEEGEDDDEDDEDEDEDEDEDDEDEDEDEDDENEDEDDWGDQALGRTNLRSANLIGARAGSGDARSWPCSEHRPGVRIEQPRRSPWMA